MTFAASTFLAQFLFQACSIRVNNGRYLFSKLSSSFKGTDSVQFHAFPAATNATKIFFFPSLYLLEWYIDIYIILVTIGLVSTNCKIFSFLENNWYVNPFERNPYHGNSYTIFFFFFLFLQYSFEILSNKRTIGVRLLRMDRRKIGFLSWYRSKWGSFENIRVECCARNWQTLSVGKQEWILDKGAKLRCLWGKFHVSILHSLKKRGRG